MSKGIYERTPEIRAKMSKSHTGVPFSPEHCSAISAAKKGAPKSPSHCAALSDALMGHEVSEEARAAMSEAQTEYYSNQANRDAKSETMKNSEANKIAIELMRGGQDIVEHHYIYDHSDLLKYTMKMTRSRHTRLHRLMQKAGIKVPHINMKENE